MTDPGRTSDRNMNANTRRGSLLAEGNDGRGKRACVELVLVFVARRGLGEAEKCRRPVRAGRAEWATLLT